MSNSSSVRGQGTQGLPNRFKEQIFNLLTLLSLNAVIAFLILEPPACSAIILANVIELGTASIIPRQSPVLQQPYGNISKFRPASFQHLSTTRRTAIVN